MENTINIFFEMQAKKTPESIAIVDSKKEINYDELNKKVNRFSNYLIDKGIEKNDRVCLVMDHSIEMIVTILAIIKSGATYIPIEPTFPVKRINLIIEESEAKFVVTNEKYNEIFIAKDKLIYYNEKNLKTFSEENPNNLNEEDTVMYVLYTSGTTGKPKGVMVEHRNVLNYVMNFKNYFKISKDDKMLQASVCTFDIFVEEVFPILLTGGCLVIADSNKTKNHMDLLELIKEKQITLTSTFPYFLNDINKSINSLDEIPDSWRIAISGGDVLRKEFLTKISNKLRVFNTYGPTETTVCASYYEYDKDYNLDSVPIGKAIENVDILILDDELNKVKDGEYGEICISGAGVSRGYLNLEEKTNENFIINPYNTNERLYKTGDLGRKLPDGNFDFLKRKDEQVMILGKRVEPLEVENVMLKIDTIENVIVKPCQDVKGYSYLIAYYISNDENIDNIVEIKKKMREYLPEFMIPEFFIKMYEFPLMANGKINKKAFPVVMK